MLQFLIHFFRRFTADASAALPPQGSALFARDYRGALSARNVNAALPGRIQFSAIETR